MLFGFNCSVRLFYAAFCFNELSTGSVLCLLNASSGKRFPQCHSSIVDTKIDDHGVCWGNGWILAPWWFSVAYKVALDLPYCLMCSAPYCLMCMAIKMARKARPFFSVVDFMSCITIVKRPYYGLSNIKLQMLIIISLVWLYIMDTRWQQWMPFWLSLLTAGKRLL